MKNIINQYIEYLSFFHLNSAHEYWHQNFIACNTRNKLASTNRVYIPDQLHEKNILELKNYFDDVDFTFWLTESNSQGNKSIAEMGSTLRFSYPLMLLNVSQLISCELNPSIQVRQLISHQEILSTWAPLVAKAYEKIDSVEFLKFVSYLLSTQKNESIKFYIGYYQDQPCATSMIILRDNLCDIHWVGTLPTFRNKGVGLAVTLQPLMQLKTTVENAILYASEMGKPIYEKMGFKEICKVNVYTS